MPSISAPAAVLRAKETLKDLYEDDPPRALALEEVELVNDSNHSMWSITLGFHRQKSVAVHASAGALASYLSPTASHIENRVYKTIYIDAETGDFVKMDMRNTS